MILTQSSLSLSSCAIHDEGLAFRLSGHHFAKVGESVAHPLQLLFRQLPKFPFEPVTNRTLFTPQLLVARAFEDLGHHRHLPLHHHHRVRRADHQTEVLHDQPEDPERPVLQFGGERLVQTSGFQSDHLDDRRTDGQPSDDFTDLKRPKLDLTRFQLICRRTIPN